MVSSGLMLVTKTLLGLELVGLEITDFSELFDFEDDMAGSFGG